MVAGANWRRILAIVSRRGRAASPLEMHPIDGLGRRNRTLRGCGRYVAAQRHLAEHGDVGDDRGDSQGHGFDGRHAEALEQGREDERGGAAVEGAELASDTKPVILTWSSRPSSRTTSTVAGIFSLTFAETLALGALRRRSPTSTRASSGRRARSLREAADQRRQIFVRPVEGDAQQVRSIAGDRIGSRRHRAARRRSGPRWGESLEAQALAETNGARPALPTAEMVTMASDRRSAYCWAALSQMRCGRDTSSGKFLLSRSCKTTTDRRERTTGGRK